jgi:hypothetical protein
MFASAFAAASSPAGDANQFTASITMVAVTVPANEPVPYLDGAGWVIYGKRATEPRRQLLEVARQTHNWNGRSARDAAMIVSLGPMPTLGGFLRTAKSLRDMGLCLVFVNEGGRDSPAVSGIRQVEVPGLRVC